MTLTMKVKCASYRHRFVSASVEMLRRHHLVKIHPPKWVRRYVVLEAFRLVCVVLRTVRPSSGNTSCHRCVHCIPASGLCYASLFYIRSSRQWAHTVSFFFHQHSRNPSTPCLSFSVSLCPVSLSSRLLIIPLVVALPPYLVASIKLFMHITIIHLMWRRARHPFSKQLIYVS